MGSTMSHRRTRRTSFFLAPALLMGVALAACLDPVEVEVVEDPPIETVEFDTSLEIDLGEFLELPSGVWVRSDEPGEGEPAELGQLVGIYFRGWASNGTLFDQIEEEDGPFPEFQLGTPGPLAALTRGVEGMRLGETRTVLAPPSLAFGSSEAIAAVPPNSWIVLRIRLMRLDGATP